MARKAQSIPQQDSDESLTRVFFRGFFLPLRLIAKGLEWLGHKPPLRQLGYILRWFFQLRVVRFIEVALGVRFIRGSWHELKQVTWPTRRESFRLTSAVIFFSVVFALVLAAVDYGLDKLFKQLLLK